MRPVKDEGGDGYCDAILELINQTSTVSEKLNKKLSYDIALGYVPRKIKRKGDDEGLLLMDTKLAILGYFSSMPCYKEGEETYEWASTRGSVIRQRVDDRIGKGYNKGYLYYCPRETNRRNKWKYAKKYKDKSKNVPLAVPWTCTYAGLALSRILGMIRRDVRAAKEDDDNQSNGQKRWWQ
jgi:hypothetical protein